ncbi:MAG: prolyl-tRNA synthetase [Parcubacteria group bacterium Greene0714_36]|nr:MAG: prolyl-tRNA synthetase [Parcubacteria group bacterium Greene0714_36]
MRQSRLFGKTLREDPKDEVAANARLLERGGFVYKSMAGVYEYLPLGLRVLERINTIIREEMNAIGGQEMLLSALQPKERWEKSGRWKALGEEVMYQFKDHSGRELGLGATHEEVVAEIATRSIHSYKDLPLFIYQIQTKFRDELRAKSGLMRGREFFMKDLYSFHADAADLERFYWKLADRAYRAVFKRCGLDVYITEASGGTFTKEFTHEYQVLSDAGEDLIFYCANPKCRYAQNREIATLEEGGRCAKCDGGKIRTGKSIEVGNIFRLGTKYAEAMGLFYADKNGEKRPVVMGSYGIGPGRVMATIVETHHDAQGIIWPDPVAPYAAHLIVIGNQELKIRNQGEKLYGRFVKAGIAVLYDDREDKTTGEKFADADLIGIPWRIVVSPKTIEKKGVEIKRRGDTTQKIMSVAEMLKKIK